MSILATSLNTSLASVGLSAADAGQIAATKDTLDKSFGRDSASSETKKEPATTTTLSPRARELSAEDQRQIAELKRIDAEVRAHEQAHISAGHGVITSGPNYTYTYGPDGRQYAVAGEVGIDTSPEKKPEANIDKGQRIQNAALAPAQPSSQDYAVAATGSQLETQGRTDLAEQIRAEQAAAEQAAEEAQASAAEAEQVAASREMQRNAETEAAPASLSPPEPPPKALPPEPTRPVQTYTDLAALGARTESTAQSIDTLA